jgi:hypothetical protein
MEPPASHSGDRLSHTNCSQQIVAIILDILTVNNNKHNFLPEVSAFLAELLMSCTIEEVRDGIILMNEMLTRRLVAEKDCFVRKHLQDTSREIIEICSSLLKNGASIDGNDTNLLRLVKLELARLQAISLTHLTQVRLSSSRSDFDVSWAAASIFRLIARVVIRGALHHLARSKTIIFHLRRNDEIVWFETHIGEPVEPDEFYVRIDQPRQFRSLLSSLSARLVAEQYGFSIRIPWLVLGPR